MLRLPRRVSLPTETAATLKEWIQAGAMGNVLPGEIQLRARLGVARGTLRRALDILEHEGWITPGKRGMQRQLSRPAQSLPKEKTAKKLTGIFLSPYPLVDRAVMLELNDLQKRLAEDGRVLQFMAPNIFHLSRPDHHLALLVNKNPSSAWILHGVSEKVQRWFQDQHIPAFIYGIPGPGVTLPFIVNDWEAAAFHAGVQLVRSGHRLVGILRFVTSLPAYTVIFRGLERALATVSPKASLVTILDDGTPPGVVHSLERAFAASPRPTALIFCSSAEVLTCFSWMLSKGFTVPRDLSLMALPSDCWYQDLWPPLCHYENNPGLFSHLLGQRVMELIDTGEVRAKSVRVRLEYHPGATIGPPPALPA